MNEGKRKKLLDFRLFDQKKRITGNLVHPRNDFIEFKKEDINQSIGACFRAKQGNYREKVAVQVHDRSITYGFLNNYASQVAHRVIQEYDGVGRFQAAALLFDHGIEMIIGLMGTVISGKTYVPLNPGYPLERLEYMLQNSEAAIIVTHSPYHRLAETLRNRVNKNIRLIDIDGIDPNGSTIPPQVSIDPDQVAYVLYTSGSTGKPKGVMQNHKNVLHFARIYTNALHIHQEDRLTLFSSYSFDAAKMDIFGALLNGATLYPFDIKQEGNLYRLPQWLQKEKITIYHSIPTVYRYFTDLLTNKTGKENSQASLFPHLRFIVLGGEPVYKNDVEIYKKYFNDDCIFINGLGPTESTVTLQYFIDKKTPLKQEAVPVGYPAAETEVFLLDEDDREAVVNAEGEIIYKSDYLSLGYLKMPEKTNAVFVTDPLTDQGRVYRSGDLGRRLEDGSIQYVGRKDFQVKVRGYRIELGEIESKLDCIQGIKKSVVVCRQNQENENRLIAYYQTDDGVVKDEYELVRQLKEYLPDYMIPAAFFRLESFPLTTTGKIDRRALLDHTEARKLNLNRVKYAAPRNKIEEKLVEIWAEVLGHAQAKIGIDDNFFELGGHSLKAILLVSRIHKELHVKLSLAELFKSPFIRKLAQTINKQTKDKYTGIAAAEKKKYYTLSSAQKRLYILKQMDPGNTVYNITTAVTLEGEIDKPRLQQTCRELIRRHESLRSSFHMIGNEPVQRIHEDSQLAQVEVEEIEGTRGLAPLSKHPPAPVPQLAASVIKNFLRPFDLSQAPLVRVGLVELPHTTAALRIHPRRGTDNSQEGRGHKYILMIDMHHIVSDLTSLGVFTYDFAADYQGETQPELRIQYKDYSEWQNREKQKNTGILKRQEVFWLKQLGGEITVPELPLDYPRPKIQNFAGHTRHFEIGARETNGLKTLALQEGTTLFMVILAICYTWLSKLTGQEAINVGTVTAGRNHEDFQPIIGMFVNTLVLRHFPDAEKTFIEFLQEVKERTLAAFENQEYQFEDLVEKAAVTRDTSRNPLFDVMFTLDKSTITGEEVPGLKVQPYPFERGISKFDLTLRGLDTGNQLTFSVEYGKKLFKEVTVKRFIHYFKRIIISVLKAGGAEQRLSDIDILPEEEKQQVLYDFNNTGKEYPQDKTLPQLFQEQVEKTPHCIALVFKDQKLTYNALKEQVNRAAGVLKAKGVKNNSIVGIMVERSLEMIVGIFAVLESGGAYLPLDPQYPADRVKYMLKNSSAKILITTPGTHMESEEESTELLAIPSQLPAANEPDMMSRDSSPGEGSPENLVYVIYTSGSTGTPKGTPIRTKGFVNLVRWYLEEFQLTRASRFLLIAPISFDLAQKNLFAPLISGGCLCLAPPGLPDYGNLSSYIAKEGQTVLNCAPSIFYPFMEINAADAFKQLKSLRYLFLGGESIQLTKLLPWMNSDAYNCEVVNTYGPTECTDVVSYYRINRETVEQPITIPIGKPIYNVLLYILDRHGKVLPVGIPGELCIGGIGIGRGYLNRPELTAEKFVLAHSSWLIADRVVKEETADFPMSYELSAISYIYRTGDLARWLPQGQIEYRGRIDQQVKIRGYRIEPGEIESRLLSYPRIKDTVVLTKEDENGEKYLCAYFVSDNGSPVPVLREYLSKGLPDYMIPSYFIGLEQIPLTPSGKVDRKALPAPKYEAGKNYTAPVNETQERLVKIWAEVLGTRKSASIGINDNFFERGGHSLKATIMAAKIQEEFNVKFPLTEIFLNPTIEKMAKAIKGTAADKYASIEPAEKKEYYELSSAQKRLYILQQMEPNITSYHISAAFELEEVPDIPNLEDALRRLIQRHESFRTCFQLLKEAPVQRIHNQVAFEIEYDQVKVKDEQPPLFEGTMGHAPLSVGPVTHNPQPATALISSFIRPFDLSQAPLLRVGLAEPPHTPAVLRLHPRRGTYNSQKGREHKYILMIDMHHIIADGTSMALFTRDFMALYRGEKLPALRVRYKDYSQWSNRARHHHSIKKQEDYWLNQLAGEIPMVNLPIDYPRPLKQDFQGNTLHFEINEEDTRALKSLALQEELTLFMVLLSTFNILLSKLCGQEDMIVGTPIAARRHTDLQEIIGMFVNTLALRNFPLPGKSFTIFLKEVKTQTLKAFENQEYPFEELVEKVKVERNPNRNPLFDVMFVLQNIEINEIEISNLGLKPYEYENRVSKFDLTLNGIEHRSKVVFTVEYCSALFRKETILRFIKGFKNILSSIINDPKQKISEISIIPEEEKCRILHEFNDTVVGYPRGKTIHRLFAEQVKQTPDYIVLLGHSEGTRGLAPLSDPIHITYHQLNRKSDQLPRLLMKKGVTSETIVGIMVGRSIENIIGILGILKAGGAYLPIDPEYPPERINYMLDDSNVEVLLTTSKLQAKVKAEFEENIRQPRQLPLQLIDIESEPASTFEPLSSTLTSTSTCQVSPANLAYIMYTSGSTGKPKGVLAVHQNVVRLVTHCNYVELGEETRILQTGAPVFDATTFEIWGSLLNGGQLVLVKKEIILDANRLEQALKKLKITTLWLSSPLFNQLVRDNDQIFSNLSHLLVGGDILSPGLINRLRNKNEKLKIINGYGPTENTTFSTTFLINKDYEDNIPIGKPIGNSTAYILDNQGLLQPIGIFGELWVGGDGVSRGYLNSPELTAEKFGHDLWDYRDYQDKKNKSFYGGVQKLHGVVFSKRPPLVAEGRIYKTGDLCRWLPDGNIEFLGRKDHQVKIRGFRVECGEIENHLLKINKIKEAVVVVKGNKSGDKYLCAYIATEEEFDVSTVRNQLAKDLPDYMIPSYFVPLVKMPLTPNGKIDRKALPEPGYIVKKDHTPPGNEIQKQLVTIWAQILGREASHASQLHETIGIHDNFFELGGHSLKATILVSKIHQALNVKVPLAEIFVNPTIEGLAKTIKAAARDKYAAIEPGEEKEYYKLSPAQKRLYVLQRMEPTITNYHISGAFELEGVVEITKLEEAFKRLVQRHESFRTSFQMVKGTPVQRIHDHVEFESECFEGTMGLAPLSADPATPNPQPPTALISSFIRPFDLSQAPLLRVGLIELALTPAAIRVHPRRGTYNSREGRERKYILMIDMHHIIADGTSMEVIIRDFIALYGGNRLYELRIRYRDYSGWQNRKKETPSIQKQEKYWLDQFAGEIPVLNLPLDYPRPMVQNFAGKTLHFRIEEAETIKLKSLILKEEVTLFMLFLAITNILLSKLSGQEEIIIGTPIAARPHADLQFIPGMFVNTMALSNTPAAEKTFKQFLLEVKKNTLKAFENQEYPFEDLVEKASVPRDASRNPLFDVMFILQNMETTELEIPGLKLKPYEYEQNTSKFDLTITAAETGKKLSFTLEYCTKLFKEETTLRFITYFKKIIFSIQEEPDMKIAGISIVPEQEKQLILNRFNETSTGYAADKTLYQLFQEQVEQTPDYIAVLGSSWIKHRTYMTYMTHISYRQLNRKSNQLAYLLQEKGVKPDAIVGIMVNRSIEMIMGILAILKAGSAYLPIDPGFPEERITYMLKDSGVGVLVTTPKLQVKVKAEVEEDFRKPLPLPLQFINPGTRLESAIEPSLSTLTSTSTCQVSPANLAYVIYTSGSTGKPKGVMIHHQAVHNFIIGMTQRIDFTPGKTIMALTTISFDIFVLETLLPLLQGLRIVIADERQQLDFNLLEELIVKSGVDMLQATPTRMQMFTGNGCPVSCLENLKEIMVGGEPFPGKLLGDLKQLTSAMIYNMYGPTETTVWSTMRNLTQSAVEGINIGQPIANTQIYILDKYDHPQPLGVIGDLYIGGDGLARGYINRLELSAEKFINQKLLQGVQGGGFLEKSPPGRRRLYKTDDQARWLPDGNIEFFGRIDSQVKIRGFRIELEEIEKHLLTCPDIKETAVIDRADTNDNKFLCAYLVLKNKPDIDISKLREYLSLSLPAYMIPAYFIPVEKIPLTANGKVDRKSLPDIDSIRLPLHRKEGYAAPGTDLEKLIAGIWKDVLKLEKVGIGDNFFDIGGNSLNILQVNQKLNELLEESLPAMSMFRYTTIHSLAHFLEKQGTKKELERRKRTDTLKKGKRNRQQRYQKRQQTTERLKKTLN
ncbi:MAG: amino acid adenylation domain-containing protein [Candidatus Aminicenantes bacterium]|jgi:tyrocidine synthetase-3